MSRKEYTAALHKLADIAAYLERLAYRMERHADPLVELRAMLLDTAKDLASVVELLPDDQHVADMRERGLDFHAESLTVHPTVKLDPNNFRIVGYDTAMQRVNDSDHAIPLVTLVSYHACERCGFLCPESLAICDDCLPPSKAEEVASDALSAMRGGKSGAV